MSPIERLSIGHPLGSGPYSSPVNLALARMFAPSLLGTDYQMLRLRRR